MTSSRLQPPHRLAVLLFDRLFLVTSSMPANRQSSVRFGQIQDVKTERHLFQAALRLMMPTGFQYVESRPCASISIISASRSRAAPPSMSTPSSSTRSRCPQVRETVSVIATPPKHACARGWIRPCAGPYGLREFDAALSDDAYRMMLEVRDDFIAMRRRSGLNIADVRISHGPTLPRTFRRRPMTAMRAEPSCRGGTASREGTEEGQRRRAIADRQVVEIVADASKDSEVLGPAARRAPCRSRSGEDKARRPASRRG